MPVSDLSADPRLRTLFRSELDANPEVDWFDAHTHMGGNDPDGRSATAGEILQAIDEAGQRRALIFAMHEPGGYARANDEVLGVIRGLLLIAIETCERAPDEPRAALGPALAALTLAGTPRAGVPDVSA